MKKIKDFLFAATVGVAGFIWLGLLITAIADIKNSGFGMFVAIEIAITIILAIPVALVALITGRLKMKKKVVQRSAAAVHDTNEAFENYRFEEDKKLERMAQTDDYKEERQTIQQPVRTEVNTTPAPVIQSVSVAPVTPVVTEINTVEVLSPVTKVEDNQPSQTQNTVSQPSQVTQVVERVIEQLEKFTFNVAGVTAKNDKNKDIQSLLKRNGKLHCKEFSIDLYSGYTNKDILDFVNEVYEFADLEFIDDEISFVPEPTNEYDANAIKVFIDFGEAGKHHIGYVPKKHTATLNEILNNRDIRVIEASYVGGKLKEIDYDFEKDKDVVVVNDTLTQGVEIEIRYK